MAFFPTLSAVTLALVFSCATSGELTCYMIANGVLKLWIVSGVDHQLQPTVKGFWKHGHDAFANAPMSVTGSACK